jgi:oligopeptide transport system substrate-binding protein
MKMFLHILFAAAMSVSLSSCGLFGESGPVRIAGIGPLNTRASPINGELSAPNGAMLNAIAQGLVSYDGDGQIDVGLADRWTVTADARSYIFRIREAKWKNGKKVTAQEVAGILRAYLKPSNKHVLRGDFPEVETIRAMTDYVIEVRLTTPQSGLLELLAQPSMAVVKNHMGWGPMRAKSVGRTLHLSPAPDPLAEDPEEAEAAAADPSAAIELVGTSAAGAIARFQNGYADAIIGGRFSTLPYFVVSNIGRSRLVVDPVPGLFGFAFVRAEGFLATDVNRDMLSRVIRRQRVVDAFGLTEWAAQETLRPTLYIPNLSPAALSPGWSPYDDDSRLAQAQHAVDQYRSKGGTIAPLRIAIPDSPGGRILFAYIAADFKRLGITSLRVTMNDGKADLRLIDQTIPNDDPLWPLRRLSCQKDTICNRDAQQIIERAEQTKDPIARANLIADAETILVRYSPFIPIATPLRWSVASQRLTGLRANSRAQHPLTHLIANPT